MREIREELCVDIKVGGLIDVVEYDYPDFHLTMYCYWCEIIDGDIVLNEAEAAKWLSRDELKSVDWLPADIQIIEAVHQKLKE